MKRKEWKSGKKVISDRLISDTCGVYSLLFGCYFVFFMDRRKLSLYEILVFVVYGFYLLLGLVWFVMSLSQTRQFNPEAFFIVVAFAAQFYYRHRLTNLILGILALFFSIWMLLDVINSFDLMAKGAHMDGLSEGLMVFCIVSMVMSGILIFSYTKLSFKDR